MTKNKKQNQQTKPNNNKTKRVLDKTGVPWEKKNSRTKQNQKMWFFNKTEIEDIAAIGVKNNQSIKQTTTIKTGFIRWCCKQPGELTQILTVQ